VNASRSDPPTPRARARMRCSGGSRSGRLARRRRGSGDGSAGNRGVRSFGCASCRDSPPRQLRTTRRRTRRRRRAMGGASSPREVGACAPLTQGCRGGRRDSAWGGRRSVRHQAAYERGDVRHGGDWGCGGGHVVHGHNACRAPEEEEARLLYPEVSDRFPRCRIFEERGLDFLAFVFEGWRSPCPPSRLQRC
jgi:hypothetical protein